MSKSGRYSLNRALLIVPHLPVDQEHSKVDRVEVRDDGVEAGGQAPGGRHDDVAAVGNHD